MNSIPKYTVLHLTLSAKMDEKAISVHTKGLSAYSVQNHCR